MKAFTESLLSAVELEIPVKLDECSSASVRFIETHLEDLKLIFDRGP